MQHVTSHKWMLKRILRLDGTMDVQVDRIYYQTETVHLNQHGLEHMHLLLARELELCNMQYEWSEMPVVKERPNKKRKVLYPVETSSDG